MELYFHKYYLVELYILVLLIQCENIFQFNFIFDKICIVKHALKIHPNVIVVVLSGNSLTTTCIKHYGIAVMVSLT